MAEDKKPYDPNDPYIMLVTSKTPKQCGTCKWYRGEGVCDVDERGLTTKVDPVESCCNRWAEIQAELTKIGQRLAEEKLEEPPNVFWNDINPSQRQHLIDPNQLNNTRELALKKYEDLSPEEKELVDRNMKSRFDKPEGKPIEEDVKKWYDDLTPSQRQHFVDPDNWYLPESMELSEKDYDSLDDSEKQEIISTFSFRHGGLDISKLIEGKQGVFRDKTEDSIETKKAQLKLKMRLASIGIKFDNKYKPGDAPTRAYEKNTPLREEVPFGTKMQGMEGHFEKNMIEKNAVKNRKQIRPQKPTQSDFSNIISAARQKIAEIRIDKAHNHRIEVFQTPHGLQRSASLVEGSHQGKFVKYWLLNAKQTNGNGWGVASSTIEQNIKNFEGMPFVVTAKSWIPDSIYGENFTHPYIPTNNLNVIYAHQSRFAVGTISKIIKEGDDYYAMIEMLPKYANYTPPPFCSPGIYQLDRHEPMNNISKWAPLHLAGLWEDPAYGARVAIFKGTCIGTSNECYVQFRGAKLEMTTTTCPVLGARKEELKSRVAAVGIKLPSDKETEEKINRPYDSPQFNMTPEEFLKQRGKPVRPPKPTQKDRLKIISAALQPNGNLLGPHQRLNPNVALKNEVPFGKENRTKNEIKTDTINRIGSGFDALGKDTKINPGKPKQRDRIRIIKAQLESKRQMLALHIRANEVMNDILHNGGVQKKPGSGTFIDQEGRIIGDPHTTHYEKVRELAGKVGVKIGRPTTAMGEGSDDYVDDEHIHNFLQKTGLVRLQHFPGTQSSTVHIASPLTSSQRQTIKNITEDDPNSRLGYFVGPKYETAANGEGFRNLMLDHAKQFNPQRKADFDLMTYKDSKPVHMIKKKLQDKRLAQMFAVLVTPESTIENFKKQKNLDYKGGFTFDPRANKVVTPQELRKNYGRPNTDMHMIATTDNSEGPDALKGELQKIGPQHFIGGYTGMDGKPKTDSVYILHSNDPQEVQANLQNHKQESAFTIHPNGKTELTMNKSLNIPKVK